MYGTGTSKIMKSHLADETTAPDPVTRYRVNNQADQEAREQVETLMEQMAEKQGVTEELKVQNRTKWVRLMNNIKASAEEMVLREILYI